MQVVKPEQVASILTLMRNIAEGQWYRYLS
jgi:hypothetical protein